MIERSVNYGVNLYRVENTRTLRELTPPFDSITMESRVNNTPLKYGSYQLINYYQPLIARHVNRHGNESDPVIVFNGSYE
jgi:hypothetical protein